MFNVCDNCHQYEAEKIIDPSGPYAICPHCQHKHPFRQLPLLIICGPSAAGKTTICKALTAQMDEVVMLDGDLLWRSEFNSPENDYRDFFETWLRLGKNINQAGRPFLLFNSGAIPPNVEPCIERRYFSRSHYLALICDDDTLVHRLKKRPAWRQTSNQEFIDDQLIFNKWFREEAATQNPPIDLIDTSDTPPNTTIQQVRTWIMSKIQ